MPMEEIVDAIKELSGNTEQETTVDHVETTDRDTTGELSPKEPAREPNPLAAEEPKTSISPAPAPHKSGALRAPISWKPEEREGWEKLDARHQQAILRRELETSQALSQSDRAREFSSSMQQTLSPYMAMIQAEGSNPVQAVASLFQTAAILRTAPPMQKASMLADLIMTHQIDPSLLDTALSSKLQGRPAPNDPMTHLMAQFDQKLQPIQDQLRTFQQREQVQHQQAEQKAEQTLTEFMQDPANEFAGDVAEDMADLLDLATRRGLTLTLQDAYKRATLAHPTISQIMERRMLKGGAAQQTAAASRARQASASVSDSGAPSQVVEETDGGDIRSALTASIRTLSQRR